MKNNTLVWCKTKEQVRRVLSKAKKMGYHMPDLDDYTERLWNTHESETVINLHGDGQVITYCYKDWYIDYPNLGKIISVDEFFSRKPILITRNGRLTIAENKNTGEKGIASCSPDDTYDFHTGALIALARLVAKDGVISGDAETVLRGLMSDKPIAYAFAKKDTKFKVGDLVTLKNGLVPGEVYGDMHIYKGKMFDSIYGKPQEVVDVTKGETRSAIYETKSGFYYPEEMLEAWDESKIREGDIVEVITTCANYPCYTEWIDEYIADRTLAKRFGYGNSPKKLEKYEVVKIASHGINDEMLAYIKPCSDPIGSCYIVGVRGLKRVAK